MYLEESALTPEILSSIKFGGVHVFQSISSRSGSVILSAETDTRAYNPVVFEWSGKGMRNFRGSGLFKFLDLEINFSQEQKNCTWSSSGLILGRAHFKWQFFIHFNTNEIEIEFHDGKLGLLCRERNGTWVSKNLYGYLIIDSKRIDYLMYGGDVQANAKLFSSESVNVLMHFVPRDRMFILAVIAWSITLQSFVLDT